MKSRISPMRHLKRMRAPLLVVHGELDTNVPLGEAHQIVEALRALGRPVEALEYYEVLAGVRICLVVVRSTQLLVREGRLPPASRAGFQNPLVHLLGSKLGLECHGPIDDYMELVTLMNSR